MKKFCITFAGVVGSSKTPIANYLSGNLNLPIINNDAIRTEVIEDLSKFDEEEYRKRRNARVRSVLESGTSFIYDVSVDREWKTLREWLSNYGYGWFIISMDLSKEKILELYEVKGYHESKKGLEQLVVDHENFVREFGEEIGVRILDGEFEERLRVALDVAKDFVGRV
jgi:hypothetical protein